MKIPNTTGCGIRTAIAMLCCMIVSTALGISDPKEREGFYIVVNYVPQEYKERVDGFYLVSKEQKVSFPFLDVEIAVDKDIDDVRKELVKAIAHHHHQKFPESGVFPGVNIISATDANKAGDGVIVMGQAKHPGIIPLNDGLTVFQAIKAAGGGNEWSSMRGVAVFRSRKIIYCDLTVAESRKVRCKPGDLVVVPVKNFVPEGGYR
jgi:protein involved in polysaccharide export with SLBB domain